MSKIAVLIDVQVGFTTEELINPTATEKLPYLKAVVDELKQLGYKFVSTKDTHGAKEEYEKTLEGKSIPYHCGEGTNGNEVAEPVRSALRQANTTWITKDRFGSISLVDYLLKEEAEQEIEEIRFCGFVTDICVISNVLLVRVHFPNTRIVVDAAGCAGLDEEGHKAALLVMKRCLVEVINE